MRAQRPAGAAPCVDATAESLPFEDRSFDAAMAFATIDHWQDPIAGLREMRRVARRVVVFTCDAGDADLFWLNRDYPAGVRRPLGRPAFADRAGRCDRSSDRAGARSVGLRRRLYRCSSGSDPAVRPEIFTRGWSDQ
jgi:SAM-dependent methyltransferase